MAVAGRQRTYELKEGMAKRTVLEVEADDVAASLKFASAKVTKVSRSRPAEEKAGVAGRAEADPRHPRFPAQAS